MTCTNAGRSLPSTGRFCQNRAVEPVDSDDAAVYAALARELGDLDDVGATLQALADVAVHLVPTDWAAVLVADRLTDRPARQSATTDTELLGTVADIAGGVDRTPGIDAYSGGEVVVVDDLTGDRRWPEYADQMVRRTPVRAVLSEPLTLRDTRIGVMTFYARTPGAFGPAERRRAAILADHAVLALGKALSETRAANLELALESNREVGIAIGILVERHRMTAPEAFAALRRVSQHLNRRLVDVAEDLVRTGRLPEVPPPRRGSARTHRG